ncbi:MAG: ThuA domain-containing protein [Verrucomicrobiales bacterium]|nr:ThuA domain-containing protein [Verrucomicrobiales bacterium]
MKLPPQLLVILFLLAGMLCLPPASQARPNEGPVRVLFVGHEAQNHRSDLYYPMLMNALGRDAIWFDYVTTPEAAFGDAGFLANYDAVLLYANHAKIDPAHWENLKSFIEEGGGFVPVHCASWCFQNIPEFDQVVGGRFAHHKTAIFRPKTMAPDHAAIKDVPGFEAWDETYVHINHNPTDRIVLQVREVAPEDNITEPEPWTWIRTQGKGRVFYTASGHDERVWSLPEFHQLLKRGILWSVGEARLASYEAFLTQREPEERVKDPNVANYEKRPEPLTFQKPYSVKGSLERTQVAADLKLELFASDPDIGKPIAMAWDERGRCWVAETYDYPHGVKPDGVGSDRIRICEDTDGDGRADKFTTFADGLNIPTGLVFSKGGIIVSQPPRFYFLKDTDGDDVADVKEEIMTGWGIGDTHAQASNLHYGYDNWLHGAVGYSAYEGTVGGKELSFRMGTYRFRPDGSTMEFLHQFTNNTWAHSQNEAGDNFGGTANGAPIFFGGIPQTIVPEGMRAMTAKKINLVDAAHALTPNFRQVDVMGGYTSAAGSAFIYSDNLPARLQGMAMVTEPTMKIVALMDVRPDGAGYTAHDGMNLLASTDEWTSPVYAEVGPDGAIWIADWQNFIIQHNPTPSMDRGGYDAKTGVGGAHENPLRDHSRGRIYRVVWEKATAPEVKSLSPSDVPALVAALSAGTQHWRLTAQRLLVEGGHRTAAPALAALVTANDGSIAAIHALWVLHGLGTIDAATHQAALLAKDARLRRNAIRALGSDEAAAKLFFSSGVVTDPDLNTRLAAFVKLGEFSSTPEIQTLVKRLAMDEVTRKDEWLTEAAKVLSAVHDAALYTEGPNLLPNSGLEEVGSDGFPVGWKRRDYGGEPKKAGNESAEWTIVSGEGMVRSGKNAFRCITRAPADTSFFADVDLKPNTEYKLSAWVKAHGFKNPSKVSLNDHIGRAETEKVTRQSGWVKVETTFNSRDRPKASINLLHVAWGDSYFDDVSLNELIPADESEILLTGDAKRGEEIYWKHPVAGCMNCHMLGGKGSPVGPALDGIATRKDAAYIAQSLVEPNAVLAEEYTATPVSPMPPMGLILKPQELEDIKAFLATLK